MKENGEILVSLLFYIECACGERKMNGCDTKNCKSRSG